MPFPDGPKTKGFTVNVTVETLAPCKKLVRIEVDAQAVDSAFEEMTKNFVRQAALPGFRPGKAPKAMVLKRYDSEIQDEVKKKLVPDSYRQAVKDQNLKVVGYPDIEEIQFGKGQSLQFAATIETAPEFELPEYKGLPVKRETKQVSDEEFVVTGDLTIKDVTRSVDLEVEFLGEGGDPWGGTRVGVEAKGQISRKDFGIDFNIPVAGADKAMIGDTIKLLINAEAVLQAPAEA